jgi:large exoprotein involved in heme utilization and adhesion
LTDGPGDAGSIDLVVAGSLEMEGLTWIAADTGAGVRGSAGDITIAAGSVRLGEDARVNSSTAGYGNAGNITIRAEDSILVDHEDGEPLVLQSAVLQDPNAELSSLTGFFSVTVVPGGIGGSITLDAPEITLTNGAIVATSTVGGGDAGDLFLRGERIRVLNGAFVDSTSLPLIGVPGGAAGDVNLVATESIEVVGQRLGDVSRVASATLGSGETGRVTLAAPRILVDGGAVATGAMPSPLRQEGQGGGDITLAADELVVRGGGLVDASSFVAGPGGRIDATASGSIVVTGAGSSIASRTGGDGTGGDVTLRAPSVEVSGGGEVSARSAADYGDTSRIFAGFIDENVIGIPPRKATGDAGDIRLEAAEVRLAAGTISTSAPEADGGNVTIQARDLVHLVAGEITAAVQNFGTGGNISIDPVFVILQDGSQIVATAVGGEGGHIQITTENFFAFPDTLITASSEFGVDGIVAIHAPDVDLAGTLTALPASFLDAASLLRERCAARRGGERAGSFAVRGAGGIPAEPDGLLPAAASFEAVPTLASAAPRSAGALHEVPGLALVASCP